MKPYTFTVNDAADIDLDRIIKENKERGIYATLVIEVKVTPIPPATPTLSLQGHILEILKDGPATTREICARREIENGLQYGSTIGATHGAIASLLRTLEVRRVPQQGKLPHSYELAGARKDRERVLDALKDKPPLTMYDLRRTVGGHLSTDDWVQYQVLSLEDEGKIAQRSLNPPFAKLYELASTTKERILEILKPGPLTLLQIWDKLGHQTDDEMNQLMSVGSVVEIHAGVDKVYGLPSILEEKR